MEESDRAKLSRHEKAWQDVKRTCVQCEPEADRYVPLHCPGCGRFVKSEDLYCPDCFQELKDNCPHCGELIRLSRDWCPYCHRLLD